MIPHKTIFELMFVKRNLLKIILLTLFICLFSAYFIFDLNDILNFENFLKVHQQLKATVSQNIALYAVIYILIYWVVVGLSIPGASAMSIIGGYLFGFVIGISCILIGATLGACTIFLLARTTLGEFLHERASGWVSKLEKGFQKNAFFYLLFLRFIPLFPFWLTNIVAASLNMRLKPFAIATFLGIIPGVTVYVSLGRGLDHLLEEGHEINLALIFEPKFFVPILALGVIALIPITYKKIKKKFKWAE